MDARLGAFLARVHALDACGTGLLCPDEAGEDATGTAVTWHGYFHNRLDDHLAVCRETDAVSKEEEESIRRAFRSRPPSGV